MRPTPYADVNAVLGAIVTRHRALLGDRLAGLYVFGSLVTGDFEHDKSDIDLIAVLRDGLDEHDLAALRRLHAEIARGHPFWHDRIEVFYADVAGAGDLTAPHRIAVISPGEPLHFKMSEHDWLIHRHVARERGLALAGPPFATLMPPVPPGVMRANIRGNARDWRDWITHAEIIRPRKYQAHMIVTMCRELYRFAHEGEIASKPAAAAWAMQTYPEWAPLIRQALAWRQRWRETDVDHDATLPETLRFVHFALDTILKG